MKRRLILHLGTAKTGTTTIQGFLRQNPDILAAARIVYPKLGADLTNHAAFQRTALTTYLEREGNHVALALEIQRRRDAPVTTFETPLWATAFRRIDESGAQTAILSYENFAMFAESYRFDVLASKLREYSVCGVVYLRPQEDFVTSLYGQVVHGKDRLAVPMSDFGVFRAPQRLSYSKRLDAVRSCIPLDDLVVANFDLAARSGLLGDFIERTALPRDQLLSGTEPGARNISLPHWSTLFLARCNQNDLPDVPFLEVVTAFRRFALAREAIADLRPGLDTATPDERRTLRDVMAADAERLWKRYGVALAGKAREPAPYRPFDEDDFRTIKSALAAHVSDATRDALDRI